MLTTKAHTICTSDMTAARRVRGHRLATVAVLVTTACAGADPLGPSAPPVTYAAGSIEASLETIRRQYNLPGLAAAIVRNGAITERAAIGVRRAGDTTKVSIDDKWHVGSITKSMTATVAARLVDKGRLQWSTTVAEALPDLAAAGNPAWRSVTLAALLAMRGGVNDAAVESKHAAAIDAMRTADPIAQRKALANFILSEAPSPASGSAYRYANGSYALAGHVMERLTNTPWEALMQQEVFAPLALTSGGFGAPATAAAARPDQPWGHTPNGRYMLPVVPGPNADNPAAIGPAGTVHISVGDLARYMIAHLGSARGGTTYLTASSGARVHTSAGAIDTTGTGYGMGWVVYPDRNGGGPTLAHDGSNTNFFTLVMMKPTENLAIVIATNAGGDPAEKAIAAAFAAMIQRATSISGKVAR